MLKLFLFFLPSEYTLATIPQPSDERVEIGEIAARKVAVKTFHGYYWTGRVKKHQSLLLEQLKKDGMTVIGEPVFAGYNSPFAFPLFVKNEIWVEIE